jgi:hypothetical protein
MRTDPNSQGIPVTEEHSPTPAEQEQDIAGTAIDTTVPHSARIWNYWLGGKDNYEIDRVAGDQFSAIYPGIVDIARADRAFLGRVIRFLAGEAGVRQFLDVGTGLASTPVRPWRRRCGSIRRRVLSRTGPAPPSSSPATSTAWNWSNQEWSTLTTGGRILAPPADLRFRSWAP